MLRYLILLTVFLPMGALRAQVVDTDSLAAEAAVRAFHIALRAGDSPAIERFLAPDAVILEGGARESRAEYLSHHLKADIEFAQAVPSQFEKMESRVQGNVAWVITTSVSAGSFRSREVKLKGAELVVLTRSGADWTIRAVHWSSRQAK